MFKFSLWANKVLFPYLVLEGLNMKIIPLLFGLLKEVAFFFVPLGLLYERSWGKRRCELQFIILDLAIPGQHSLFNTAQHSGNTYSFLKVVCSRVFTCELRCMSYTCCSMGCYVAPESIYPGDPNHHFISHPRKEVSIFISQLCFALCLYLLT